MSFYINNPNACRPGPICGNPLNGLCEKALIEVRKVFDACRRISAETDLILDLVNFNPPGPILPLTFISATNNPELPVTVSDVVIDRIESRPNFANVSATLTIPILVSYRDSNGDLGTAETNIVITENVVMFVPQPAVVPVDVTAVVTFTSVSGSIDNTGTVLTVTGCLQVILKITSKVDILIPSYGYPFIPPCHQAEDRICPIVSELPLFPTAVTN